MCATRLVLPVYTSLLRSLASVGLVSLPVLSCFAADFDRVVVSGRGLSQKPFFDLLGTPSKDKGHVILSVRPWAEKR